MSPSVPTVPAQLAMAKRMINASICAYQIHEKGWTYGPGFQPLIERKVQGPGDEYYYDVIAEYQDAVGFVGHSSTYTPHFVASGDDKINAALVGAMSDGNMVISLRGTLPPNIVNNDLLEWIKDWIQDAKIKPTPWQMAKAPYTNVCNVATGFAEPAMNLWPHIAGFMDTVIADHGSTGVVITGHSKGAAMTFLIASLVALHYPQFKGKIQVHAFAAPVTGDTNFCNAYNGMGLGETTHRYQVQNDMVPFVPLWTSEDLFAAVSMKGIADEIAWVLAALGVAYYTKGGYSAVGDFTYFNSSHQLVPGAVVGTSALPAVAATLQAGLNGNLADFGVIAAAHSAVDSYRLCFT